MDHHKKIIIVVLLAFLLLILVAGYFTFFPYSRELTLTYSTQSIDISKESSTFKQGSLESSEKLKVEIAYPAGGETFVGGEPMEIKWNSNYINSAGHSLTVHLVSKGCFTSSCHLYGSATKKQWHDDFQLEDYTPNDGEFSFNMSSANLFLPEGEYKLIFVLGSEIARISTEDIVGQSQFFTIRTPEIIPDDKITGFNVGDLGGDFKVSSFKVYRLEPDYTEFIVTFVGTTTVEGNVSLSNEGETCILISDSDLQKIPTIFSKPWPRLCWSVNNDLLTTLQKYNNKTATVKISDYSYYHAAKGGAGASAKLVEVSGN